MKDGINPQEIHAQFVRTGSTPFFTPDNKIAIYTVLKILARMKKELGMEAMHEYMDRYCAIIDRNNPKFEYAVKQALTLISIEKLYRDAMRGERK